MPMKLPLQGIFSRNAYYYDVDITVNPWYWGWDTAPESYPAQGIPINTYYSNIDLAPWWPWTSVGDFGPFKAGQEYTLTGNSEFLNPASGVKLVDMSVEGGIDAKFDILFFVMFYNDSSSSLNSPHIYIYKNGSSLTYASYSNISANYYKFALVGGSFSIGDRFGFKINPSSGVALSFKLVYWGVMIFPSRLSPSSTNPYYSPTHTTSLQVISTDYLPYEWRYPSNQQGPLNYAPNSGSIQDPRYYLYDTQFSVSTGTVYPAWAVGTSNGLYRLYHDYGWNYNTSPSAASTPSGIVVNRFRYPKQIKFGVFRVLM